MAVINTNCGSTDNGSGK